MRGHVRKRGKTWSYVLDLGMRPVERCVTCSRLGVFPMGTSRLESCPRCGGALVDGEQRRQQWVPGHATKRDAERALNEALGRMNRGAHVERSRQSFGSFVLEDWFPGMSARIRPTTLASYRINLNKHIVPALGSYLLQNVGPGT